MHNQRNFLLERERSKSHCRKVDLCDNQCHHCESHCKEDSCHKQDPCDKKDPCHKWSALDPTMDHPMHFDNDSTINQEASGQLKNVQQSSECIVIKDSCDVDVQSTDTQAAVNIQVALQAAIALVISISIADTNAGDEITQDLFAKLKSSQVNKQQLYIENSRGVNVTTTDTDIAVNAQILLQVLIALVVRLDVL
ncbi:spore coat protein X [Lentibacillus populi]|uniref:Spore coat protein X n=2 Tax=Bacillales TaxID=1385 RepID=A0A9W5TZF4_9BACI|nr:spore coat protein X [Lentibacillus populi]